MYLEKQYNSCFLNLKYKKLFYGLILLRKQFINLDIVVYYGLSNGVSSSFLESIMCSSLPILVIRRMERENNVSAFGP